jgi:DNA-binding beta-propeller fold protein YncE
MRSISKLNLLSLSIGLGLTLAAGCNNRRTGDCQDPQGCPEEMTPQPPKPKPPTEPGDDVTTVLGKDGTPFDPRGDGSSGVKTGPGGEIAIDPGNVMIGNRPVIWVANSSEGTVSKVDTRTMTESARYRTGPKGQANDPSRTTVGLNNDVVVANRGGAGATHIAGDLSQCKDKNADGKITTSTGPGDVKPWGEDECVLWYIDLPANSYPRAAVFDAEYGLDGMLSTTVYIGTYSGRILYRIDANTGAILKEINLGSTMPYGAAIDKNGVVWIRDAQGPLAYVDVKKGDIVGRTQQQPPCAYGIAVDPEGRVWTSGSGMGGQCASRYTPEPMDISKGKWDSVNLPGGTFPRGLAVDAKKMVWVADTSYGVFGVDTETLAVKHSIKLGTSNNFVGMAIDFDGMVWAINQSESRAYRIDPSNVADVKTVNVGQGPYTYSDMTGFQLRNAAAPTGRFRHTFSGCSNQTRWNRVFYTAEYEGGTSIVINARSGNSPMELEAQPWTLIAQQPPDASPVKLDKLGMRQTAQLLQLEVQLRTIHPAFTPRLTQLKVGSTCNVIQ